MKHKSRKTIFVIDNFQKIRIRDNNVDVYVLGNNTEILCTGKNVRIASVGEDSAITCTGADTMVSAAPGTILSMYEPAKKKGAKSYTKTVYIGGEIAKPYTFLQMKEGNLQEVCIPS